MQTTPKLEIAPGAWFRQGDPLYVEIYRRILQGILSGEMATGSRLPSSRVLADQLGVARSTVLLAFDQLQSEGYIESRRGSGHYVAHFAPEEVERLADGPGSGADAATPVSVNRFEFVPQSLRTAIRPVPFRANYPALDSGGMKTWITLYGKALRQAGRTVFHPGSFGESDAAGEQTLRRAIAEYIALARGVRCSPDQIIVTAGAQHAMDLLLRVIARPGRQAWIEDPCFLGALAVLRGAGLAPVAVPVDSEGIDVERGRQLAPRARLAIVCPSKQYPLGQAMSLQRRLALIDWARQNQAWIVEDDYDSEFRFRGQAIPSLQGLEGGHQVIYVGTFSKVLFPGLRIGFLVAPPTLVDPLTAVRTLAGRHGNPLDQQVLARFIAEGHLGRHIRRMRRRYRERMEALLDAGRRWLAGAVEIEAAEAGLQTIGWLAPGRDDLAVSRAAFDHGIEVANLSRYTIERRLPPGLVLGFGGFEPAELGHAARQLAGVLERLPKRPARRQAHAGSQP